MSTAAQPERSRGTGRVLNVVLWILQVLLALGILFAAVAKFTAMPASVEAFDAIGGGAWLRYLTGGLEVLGVVGLLIPRLTGLAAAALALLLVGAVLVQAFAVGHGALTPVPYLVVALVIAWFRRDSTRRLAGLVTGRGARTGAPAEADRAAAG